MSRISNLKRLPNEEIKMRFKEKLLEQKAEISKLNEPEATQVLTFIEMMPEAVKSTYLKARLKRASAKSLAKAQCQNCVGYEDMKNQIGGCRTYTCALYAYRPYQNKEILK